MQLPIFYGELENPGCSLGDVDLCIKEANTHWKKGGSLSAKSCELISRETKDAMGV